jgi:signal transduction histidine kinase/integral membrane sensor domain MASE1
MTRRVRYVASAGELLGLAALYVVAARIGLAMDAVAGFATLVWPPSGIALAALLLRGYRLWPGVMIGAGVANLLTGAPILVALGIASGNTLEALLGAYALRRLSGFRTSLDRLRDVLGLIVLAAILSTTVSATIGVSSLYLGGIVSAPQFAHAWQAWWLGDLIGDLLVAPAILVWANASRVRPPPYRALEAVALGVSVIAVCLIIFGRPGTMRADTFQQAYLVFPPLVWAALRFEQRGAASTAFVVSLFAVWGTATGHGPFVRSALQEGLFALQTFMSVTAATFLVLGASIAERRLAIHDAQAAIAEQQRLLTERDIAHRRLITVLEQSPVAIGIAEVPSGRFIFVNDEAGRLLGRRPIMSKAGDPEGGGWEGRHPDGRKIGPHEWPLARAMRHGDVVRNETMRVVRADGSAIDVAVNAAPVRDRDGRIIAGVVIFWDVTAERKAEEELRIAHETVAAANRAKAEFFAVMSHELRTPLNAIAGYVEVMALGIHGPLTAQQRDSLDRIQRNQRHLLSLIDDVLIFAKIEADHLSVELKRVRVGDALTELEPLVAPELERKALTLSCAPCDSSLSVRADPEKLRQILINLVGNAIKFTPAGGHITLPAVREGDTVRSSVADTGIGIPADQLPHVFEPFFQVERGPTRRFPGVGLGLAIAHDLARAMRGDVRVESRVAEGTTVSLALPAA